MVRRLLRPVRRLVARRLLPHTPMGDRLFHWLLFVDFHRRLPIHPQLFNDALYGLKISGELENPLRVFTTDKEFVKYHVTAKIGDEFNVPTIAVLRSPEQALAYDYPGRCVIKPTHLSGEFILRKAGEAIDLERVKGWFNSPFYQTTREPNHRHLQPKVIVEPLVFDNEAIEDFKILCYRGRPRVIEVVSGRNLSQPRINFYTAQWQSFPIDMGWQAAPEMPRPESLNEMLAIAEKLSADFNFVRIDLYTDGRSVYVGEITHCQSNACGYFASLDEERKFSRILFGA